MDEHRARRWRVRARDVGVVASGLILISCGGGSSKGGSAQTGSTGATASLKRLEVEVTPGGSAALAPPTLLARLGALVLGGPRAAEAAPAIPNCAVSASTLPGVTVTTNAVGKAIRMDNHDFRVVGVMNDWRPTPKFYDVNSDRFGEVEQVYLPFSTSRDLDMGRNGSMNCWDPGDDAEDDPEGETGVNAPCTWLQYWVQVGTPEKAEAYKRYLTNYSDQQRASGRYQRPTNVRLRSLMEWLDYRRVVPGDVRLQMWLAFGFLAVCLLNTVGLLLAKFMRRSSEIGVRRALGASRRAIFAQCLVEAGTVGLAGGVLGLGLALLGLWAVRQQPASYANLAHLDPSMLVTTFVLAIAASILAGIVPAWHACQVTPAVQLKSQ